MDYANVFEFGDQGGILVMARHQTHGPTDRIHFSMDEGQCWHSVNLSEAIDISNIKCVLFFPFLGLSSLMTFHWKFEFEVRNATRSCASDL